MITRRTLLVFAAAAVPALPKERTPLRGKLGVDRQGRPHLALAGGEMVRLEGDVETMGVLTDTRLAGSDFEVLGERLKAGTFRVDPIHTTAMFVHRDGKKYSEHKHHSGV